MTTKSRSVLNATAFGAGAIGIGLLALGMAMTGPACSDSKVNTPGTAGTNGGSGGTGTAGTVGSAGTGGSAGDTAGTTGTAGDTAGTGGGVAGAGGSAGGSGGSGGATGGSGGGTGGTGGSACTSTNVVPAPAVISADTMWTRCNTYLLPADTKVAVRAPAILTIEAGTVIKAQGNSALVITQGAKIIANGTKESPIVFTSNKTVGSRAPGDWGGLIIMGKAPQNTNANSTPPSATAIFEAYGASEPDGVFGGNDPDDSSGSLKYVRSEFGGFAYMPNREWNNFTFCGVGRGTVVDYIQSHRGADDSIEFFGGTVNVKHLVLTQNEDDGFDTDNGWEGKAQFVVIQHVAPRGTDASNGYESDNHANAPSYTAVPRTLPLIYNVTSIGKKDYIGAQSFGALFRRGTGGTYYNHIITKWASGVVEVRDMDTMNQITANMLFIKNSIFFDNMGADGNWPAAMATGDIDEKAIFTNAAWMNREVDPMLGDASNLTAPNFKPAAGSPALTGGAMPPSGDAFFEQVSFVGAVGTDDWTTGWTAYPQN